MKPRWWSHRREITAQASIWEEEKNLWLLHELARLMHRAAGYGMDLRKIAECLRVMAKALDGL